MGSVKPYVGAMSIKLLGYGEFDQDLRLRPSWMNSPQLFKRGTTSPLASTRKGEPPKCWEERSHKSTSVAEDQ